MNPPQPPIITIDGHASSGKSSVARLVAQRHQLRWMSSGKLYRMVGLLAHQRQFLPQDNLTFKDPNYQANLTTLVEQLRAELIYHPDGRVTLGKINYSADLDQEATGKYASFIAKDPLCRQLLGQWQRQIAHAWYQDDPACKGMIFEGRDMGTVVFVDATLKFFLTCDLLTKARRRWHELYPHQPPQPQDLRELSTLLEKRDSRDIHRKVAPLKPAPDAHIIDTTHKDLYTVVGIISTKIAAIINT